MTIASLRKATIYGPGNSARETLESLQELGCLHLIDLAEGGDFDFAVEGSSEARNALKYLTTCSELRRKASRAGFNRRVVVEEILNVKRRERDLEDERDELRKAIRDLKPWGEFRLPEDGSLGNARMWFYVVPLLAVDQLESIECAWTIADRDHQFAYVAMVSADEPCDVPGSLVELDRRPLSELEQRLDAVEELLEDVFYERVQLTRWRDCLEFDLDKADDEANRRMAFSGVYESNNVFAVQGWVPQSHVEQLQEFATERRLALTVASPDSDETPPTLLVNPEKMRGGEGLVTFYKTPGYTMWDPSKLVLGSFALFFAMIMADAGYAALLGIVTWRMRSRLLSNASTRSFYYLLRIVSGTAFVYGVLAGSYFGWSPPEGSLLDQVKIIDVQQQSLMMPVSIAIGILHLTLANAATIVRLRGRGNSLASLGWIFVMWGGFVAGIGMLAGLEESAAEICEQMGIAGLILGFALVVLCTSERDWRTTSLKTHALRLMDGGMGLIRISNLFGDVLSYLRLFALGLSSAMLAGTFNSLAHNAWEGGGFGVLVAIVIAGLGHTLNLILSLMGGVVHGLRLNCIEFFNWSLPEEGYLFRPFAKKAKSS